MDDEEDDEDVPASDEQLAREILNKKDHQEEEPILYNSRHSPLSALHSSLFSAKLPLYFLVEQYVAPAGLLPDH